VSPDDHVAAIAAQVTVTARQASSGAIVPLELGLNGLCGGCGGRGESWAEPCHRCSGTGECARPHHFRLAVPAGVTDGTRFRFVVTPPTARATRVEVTVSVD
jgi:DnaJ-class molecular chaperone